MQDNAERQLVDSAVDGDIESFGELCRRYYSPMAAIAYSVLGDHQLAEDAAQESFARALVSLRKLKNRTRFGPWLAAICRNIAKDMLTAKARQAGVAGSSQAAPSSYTNEDGALVRRAIERLPAAAREVIVLRYYNNLSYEEITSVSGASPAAINGRLARARRRLAKHLKRNGFPESKL